MTNNNFKIFKGLLGLLVIIMTCGFYLPELYLWYLLVGLICVVLLGFFWFYPQIGLYLIAFLYPFTYLQMVYGSLNVPYVDLIALLLFISWSLKTLSFWFFKNEKISSKMFPGWILMLLFTISACLSLLNVEYEFLNDSIKYVFRPIIFFYLMFVILPFNLINTKKVLFNILKIEFVLGCFISLMGLWSLIFPPFPGLRRAIPIEIFGLYPLGTNHNLIAEILVCLIPIGFLLFFLEKDILKKNIYLLGTIFMAAINLLTLSRSGWLALAVTGVMLLIVKYEYFKKLISTYGFYVILAFLLPAFYLMYKLLTSYIALSATLNRLKLIEIAWIMFEEAPIIGKGVGTYIQTVFQVKWYIIEYGSALDAHGFIFKVLPEQGLLGLILFVGLISYLLYNIFKIYLVSNVAKNEYNWVILMLLLGAIAAVVFQVFGTSYYIAKMWLPIGLALAATKFVDTSKLKKKKNF